MFEHAKFRQQEDSSIASFQVPNTEKLCFFARLVRSLYPQNYHKAVLPHLKGEEHLKNYEVGMNQGHDPLPFGPSSEVSALASTEEERNGRIAAFQASQASHRTYIGKTVR